MTKKDIIKDTFGLLNVAADDWLKIQKTEFINLKSEFLKDKLHQKAISKYKNILTKFDRIHEIDAQIERLKIFKKNMIVSLLILLII